MELLLVGAEQTLVVGLQEAVGEPFLVIVAFSLVPEAFIVGYTYVQPGTGQDRLHLTGVCPGRVAGERLEIVPGVIFL